MPERTLPAQSVTATRNRIGFLLEMPARPSRCADDIMHFYDKRGDRDLANLPNVIHAAERNKG
jgi:hypothetical protein